MNVKSTDQAFPRASSSHGMTIRTWLAGMALSHANVIGDPEYCATQAVKLADAVIKELNKGPQP